MRSLSTGPLLLAGFLFLTQKQVQLPAQEEGKNTNSAITIIEWNIEAGGSDVGVIKSQLKELEPFNMLALSEVPPASAAEFAARWSDDSSIIGQAGGNARLLLAWDPKQFEKLESLELKQINGKEFAPGVQPAPLLAKLRHKPSNRELLVVMNHLARGSAVLRKSQANLLASWVTEQTLPVIAIGGFNFDYDFPTRRGNEAFDAFLAGGDWKWIEPKQLVDTNWADRNRDGKDDYPDSMLDFSFAAGPAKQWDITCEVIVRPGDFPDSAQTSDHRPIKTVVKVK